MTDARLRLRELDVLVGSVRVVAPHDTRKRGRLEARGHRPQAPGGVHDCGGTGRRMESRFIGGNVLGGRSRKLRVRSLDYKRSIVDSLLKKMEKTDAGKSSARLKV